MTTVDAWDLSHFVCQHWEEATGRQVPCPKHCPVQTFPAGSLAARRLEMAIAVDDLEASLPPLPRRVFQGWRRIVRWWFR